MSIEGYRAGNGSDVKITGLEHARRLSDKETETLIGALMPAGGMPIPSRAISIEVTCDPRTIRNRGSQFEI